ncbi:MAG: hypothetical protein JWN26_731 [Candidatus Saccharibacteria bacterium]|nr:hypothetical protein [Candidatus Saccharibacteria bacterium]
MLLYHFTQPFQVYYDIIKVLTFKNKHNKVPPPHESYALYT